MVVEILYKNGHRVKVGLLIKNSWGLRDPCKQTTARQLSGPARQRGARQGVAPSLAPGGQIVTLAAMNLT